MDAVALRPSLLDVTSSKKCLHLLRGNRERDETLSLATRTTVSEKISTAYPLSLAIRTRDEDPEAVLDDRVH